MNILVLNCGSSSVKFQLINTNPALIKSKSEKVLAKGMVEKIGPPPSVFHYSAFCQTPVEAAGKNHNEPVTTHVNANSHTAAIETILQTITDTSNGVLKSYNEIDAVGHRVVHGGEKFKESEIITQNILNEIHACEEFAPLHNPHNLSGYYASAKVLNNCPHVAVFDTAFHQTLPKHAYIYGLPYEMYEKYSIRRYGFHGTSHRYVANHLSELLNQPLESLKLIACHLGNGCSIAAIKNGQSVDTSMGFTPLEGLLMGTRCGDIDASIVTTLMEKEDSSISQVNNLLNKESGLLGVSGLSNDMREIEKAARDGNQRAALAISIFCYRIKKYIGAYAAAMGGADHIIFTGGIGENSALVRQQSCEELAFMGVKIDPSLNKKHVGREGCISAQNASASTWVIPTNEELMLARDTVRCVQNQQ